MYSFTPGAVNVAARGCSGATTTKLTPQVVSGRVVKTVSFFPSKSKSISQPTLLPIQLRWRVFVLSGQPESLSISFSSRSAIAEYLKNQVFSMGFLTTSLWQRQHLPSWTCSFARMPSCSHLLTVLAARYAQPFLKRSRKSHWVHL